MWTPSGIERGREFGFYPFQRVTEGQDELGGREGLDKDIGDVVQVMAGIDLHLQAAVSCPEQCLRFLTANDAVGMVEQQGERSNLLRLVDGAQYRRKHMSNGMRPAPGRPDDEGVGASWRQAGLAGEQGGQCPLKQEV